MWCNGPEASTIAASPRRTVRADRIRMRSIGERSARAVKLVFTAAVLGALFHFVGWEEIWAGLSAARLRPLAGMYAVVVVNFVLAAASLRLILTKSGVEVSLRRVLVSNALSNAYALVLPGDLAAGVSKWMVLSAATGERAKVFVGIVLNKLVFAVPPLVFGTIALAWEDPIPGVPIVAWVMLCGGVCVGAALVLLHPRWGVATVERIARAAAPLPEGVRNGFRKIADALDLVRQFRLADHLQIFALAALITGLGVVSLGLAVDALGASVPISTLVWIPLGLFLSRLLPITVGNLGLREGLLIVALGIHHVDPAVAVGVGLALFSHGILLGLIGAACQIAIGLGWTTLARDSGPLPPVLDAGASKPDEVPLVDGD